MVPEVTNGGHGRLADHPFTVVLKGIRELADTIGPTAWDMSAQEVMFALSCIRERQREEMLRNGLAASVPYMDEKDRRRL